MPFDSRLALDTILPLAEAAYSYSETGVPSGWKLDAELGPDKFGFFASRTTGSSIVSFRGTESMDEWLEDFEALPVPNAFGGGLAHKGFQDVYAKIRNSVIAGLKTVSGPLWITGHSLGAALAVLCAGDLARSGWRPLVYTFAGPRVGFPNFSDWYDRFVPDCYRIVNVRDLVPHLPLTEQGFKHVGRCVTIDGGYTEDLHVAHSLSLSYGPGLEKLIEAESNKAA